MFASCVSKQDGKQTSLGRMPELCDIVPALPQKEAPVLRKQRREQKSIRGFVSVAKLENLNLALEVDQVEFL